MCTSNYVLGLLPKTLYTGLSVCARNYACMYACNDVCICMLCVCVILCIHVWIYVCRHPCLHTCMHACTHRAKTYAYMHAFTHIQILTASIQARPKRRLICCERRTGPWPEHDVSLAEPRDGAPIRVRSSVSNLEKEAIFQPWS
jgi:hypothetical protein